MGKDEDEDEAIKNLKKTTTQLQKRRIDVKRETPRLTYLILTFCLPVYISKLILSHRKRANANVAATAVADVFFVLLFFYSILHAYSIVRLLFPVLSYAFLFAFQLTFLFCANLIFTHVKLAWASHRRQQFSRRHNLVNIKTNLNE